MIGLVYIRLVLRNTTGVNIRTADTAQQRTWYAPLPGVRKRIMSIAADNVAYAAILSDRLASKFHSAVIATCTIQMRYINLKPGTSIVYPLRNAKDDIHARSHPAMRA